MVSDALVQLLRCGSCVRFESMLTHILSKSTWLPQVIDRLIADSVGVVILQYALNANH